MILSELSKIEQAEWMVRRITDLSVPIRVSVEIIDEYDGILVDEPTQALNIDGLYWLYWAEQCIEVPTIAGPRNVDGWVLETFEEPAWTMARHDDAPPIPDVDRKAQRLDDIVAEMIGRIARDRAYEALYTEAMAAEHYG